MSVPRFLRSISPPALALLLATFTLYAQPVSFSHGTFSGLVKPSAEDLHADLNGDGREDFLTQGCGGVVVTLSSGKSGYDTGTCYKPPSGVSISFAVGDLDGDGNLDLVLEDEEGSCPNCLYEFLNNGDGTFHLASTIDTGVPVGYLATADVNHDSNIDVLFTTGYGTGNISLHVWLADGEGGFIPGPVSPISLPIAIIPKIGDFDGDGKADVFVEDPSQVNAQVLYGDGAGHFQAGPQITNGIHYEPYDLNGDGKMDLIGSDSNSIIAYYGNSNRTFTRRTIALAQCAAGIPVVADFNGDGINDVAITEEEICQPAFSTNTLNVLLGNTDGGYQPEQVVYTSDDHFLETWAPIRINSDRKADLFVQTSTADRAFDVQLLFTNTTAPFTSPGCSPPSSALGFNLCSPTKTVYSSNSVRFSLGAANQTPGRKVEVWVDGQKMAENLKGFSGYSFLDATLNLMPGTHRVSIFTAGWDNLLQEYSWTGGPGIGLALTVGLGKCAPQGVGLIVCSPLNDTTLGPSVLAWAGAQLPNTSIVRMEVWVDAVKKFSTFGSNNLKTTISLPSGAHEFTYFVVAADGTKLSSTVKATVK